MTVNELMAHGKNFTDKEADIFLDKLEELNFTEYFDASCFNGLVYETKKGALMIYAQDLEGDWKHAHRCLDTVITRIAMMNGYDVDVKEEKYFNICDDWYGCTHVFSIYHSVHKIGKSMNEDYAYFNDEHDLLEEWYNKISAKVA